MQFRPDRRAFLVGVHGETKVKAMEKSLGEAALNLKDSGVDFKDFAAELAKLDEPAPPAPAAASASSPVTPAQADPAGGDPLEAIRGAVKDAVQPLTTAVDELRGRMEAFETREKDVDGRVAAMFAPRVRPPAATTPSTDPANVVRGNSGMVAAAKDGAKLDPSNIPPHLRHYAEGFGLVPALDAAGAVQAGSGDPPADVAAAAAAATA